MMEVIQSISSWLSKNRDENSRMREISYSKSPANVRACADSRRDFWTTNWKSTVFVYFVALMSLMTQYTVSSTECDLNVKALATDLEDCDILGKLAKFNGDLFAQDAVYHKEWMNEYYTRHRSQLQKKNVW